MKGAIFTILQDMVEETMGVDVWQDIVTSCDLPSEGVYTSAQHYDDQEVFELVGAIHAYSGTPVADLLEGFGEFLFTRLHQSLPSNVELPDNYFDYLESVHTQIHVEVRKLDEDARLPQLLVVARDSKSLTLQYESPLKLCHLAIGLLRGAATLFDESVEVAMPACMHDGHEHCLLTVSRL